MVISNELKHDVYLNASDNIQISSHVEVIRFDGSSMTGSVDIAGCAGTAGTYGSFACATGCAGTFGTLGTYGCFS